MLSSSAISRVCAHTPKRPVAYNCGVINHASVGLWAILPCLKPFAHCCLMATSSLPKAARSNSIGQWQPTATGNPPAATLASWSIVCGPSSPPSACRFPISAFQLSGFQLFPPHAPILFPNHPAMARCPKTPHATELRHRCTPPRLPLHSGSQVSSLRRTIWCDQSGVEFSAMRRLPSAMATNCN